MPIKPEDMGKLSPEEMKILQNLANPTTISEEEKQEAAEYLSKVIGNVEYNKRISKALEERADQLDSLRTLQKLRHLSHKTRKAKDLPEIFKRAQENLDTIKVGNTVNPSDRLTLREFAALQDIMRVSPLLEEWKEHGILAKDETLTRIYNLSESCSQVYEEFKTMLEEQTQAQFKSGDIVMSHYSKQVNLKDRSLPREDSFTNSFISKYSHAAQLFRDTSGKLRLSHMWGFNHTSQELPITTAMDCDIFRVHTSQLLSPKMTEQLKLRYGEKFRDEVQTKFEITFDELLQNHREQIDEARITTSRIRKAGLVDFIPGGHKKWLNRKTFKSFFDKGYKKDEMICSEFVARSLISTLDETNKRLQEELGTKEQIVRIPFGRREIISRIHPERLVSLLKAQGALENVPLPHVLAQFITTEEPERQMHFHAAQTALKREDSIALLLEDKKQVQEKLVELEKSGEVAKDKIDPIIKYMDKLAQEKQWPRLSAITNEFKKIFGISTSREQLGKFIAEASVQVHNITEASIAGVYTSRLAELRKKHLTTPPIAKAR